MIMYGNLWNEIQKWHVPLPGMCSVKTKKTFIIIKNIILLN